MPENAPINAKSQLTSIKAIPQDALEAEKPQYAPEESSFSQMVSKPAESTQSSKAISPMQMATQAQNGMQTGKFSPENFMANIQQLIGSMQGMQKMLQDPNLKMNTRTQKLLEAKLSRTNDNIQFISQKANVGDQEEENEPKKQKIEALEGSGKKKSDHAAGVEKFIGYLTDGQSQLESVMHRTAHFDSSDPALMMHDIMEMQVKLYRAQVEIEFSTAVLQKAIDDTKTLMSVQL